MNTHKLVYLAGLLLALSSAKADFLSKLFPIDFEVVTNTDVARSNIELPSRSNPVYYMAISTGYRDLGAAIAGEKIPNPAATIKIVTKILAAQGYNIATKEHPPTVMLAYTWGTLHPKNPFPQTVLGNPYYLPNAVYNRNQMLAFIGAGKAGVEPENKTTPELSPGLTHLTSDGQSLWDMTNDGLYVISVAAYDLNAAKNGKAQLLWRTNISSPSRGHYLPEVIPTMLAVAAPHFGRETRQPIRVDVGDKFKPDVEIGIPTVVKDSDDKGSNRYPLK